jgi:hypothetical protein
MTPPGSWYPAPAVVAAVPSLLATAREAQVTKRTAQKSEAQGQAQALVQVRVRVRVQVT